MKSAGGFGGFGGASANSGNYRNARQNPNQNARYQNARQDPFENFYYGFQNNAYSNRVRILLIKNILIFLQPLHLFCRVEDLKKYFESLNSLKF